MASASSANTPTQILDAAERLFADQGFGATSLRSIIHAADVNLAAVHYHFGSKEKLIVATVQRMAEPIVKAQVERLAAIEAEESPLSIEGILRAFFAPPLEVIYQAQGERGLVQARFMGRCRTEPTVGPMAEQEFVASQQAFMAAFQQALPEHSESELKWKLDLIIAMLIRVLCAANQPGAMLQGNSSEEITRVIGQLVRFATPAMKA